MPGLRLMIWTLDVLAIIINMLLIVAIVLRTPKLLRTYSVFLLNNALVDITTAIASTLGAVRVVQNHDEGSMIFVFLGPCSHISQHLCRLCQGLHVNLVQHSTVVLLLSFAYRLYVLSDASSSSRLSPIHIWLMCMISLLLLALSTAGYYLDQTSASDGVPSYLQQYTTASELFVRLVFAIKFFRLITCWKSRFNVLSRFYIFSARAILVNAVECVTAVMIAIFIVRRKLIARIAQSKTVNRRHHEFIARALTYQLMLPCWVAIAAAIWLCDLTRVWSSELIERAIMVMFSVFALASPLINFSMLPPYRAMLPFAQPMNKKATSVSVAPLDFTSIAV